MANKTRFPRLTRTLQNRDMTKRVFVSILAVAVCAMLAAVILILGVLYDYFSTRDRKQLQNDTLYISQGVNLDGMAYLNTLVNADGNRITLVDTDGTVLFDNRTDPAGMDNHKNREEIAEAMAQGTGESERYSNTMAEQFYYYAKRLDNGMVLRVSNTRSSLFLLGLSMAQPTLLIVLVTAVLAALLAAKLSRNVMKPINELNLENPSSIPVYNELKPLLSRLSHQQEQIRTQIREMNRKQQEFATITESMNEGFLILDKNTDVLSYNASALELLGVYRTESGQSVLTLNRSEGFRRAVDLAIAGEHNEQSMELGDKFYQLIANPIYQDEELIGAVLIILDMTEKEQREHHRREFTANVSHELKTPLTSISGFAEIIRDGLVKTEDISRFANKIFTEAQRLIILVGDIIKLSQMDEDSIPGEKEQVDLYEVAQSVLQRLEPAAKKRQVTLSLKGAHGMVTGVPQILDEMILNLCDNAIKYNREHGSVTVTVAFDAKSVQVTVADTGIGIPAADSARVFERFYRVDKSHSKEIGGTGLGLSIVKHGAAYHGATIALASEVDKGTTIALNFWKTAESADAPKEKAQDE